MSVADIVVAEVNHFHRLKRWDDDRLYCICGWGQEEDFNSEKYDWDTPVEHIAKAALKRAKVEGA